MSRIKSYNYNSEVFVFDIEDMSKNKIREVMRNTPQHKKLISMGFEEEDLSEGIVYIKYFVGEYDTSWVLINITFSLNYGVWFNIERGNHKGIQIYIDLMKKYSDGLTTLQSNIYKEVSGETLIINKEKKYGKNSNSRNY